MLHKDGYSGIIWPNIFLLWITVAHKIYLLSFKIYLLAHKIDPEPGVGSARTNFHVTCHSVPNPFHDTVLTLSLYCKADYLISYKEALLTIFLPEKYSLL